MNESIKNWIKKNKLRKKEYIFLLNGYINFVQRENNSLNRILLTYPSDVRPLKERGLIKINDFEKNKKKNWYDFTKEGYELVKELNIIPINQIKSFLIT